MVKRILFLSIAAALGFVFCSITPAAAQGKPKVGILLTSDAAHYQVTQKGILDQFQKEGYGENKVDFDIQNGANSKEKMAAIINEFQLKKVDLILPVGTPATSAAVSAEKKIPIVFALVFDPIASKFIQSWESSGNNVVGTSTMVNMAAIINAVRKIKPLSRLGIIYTEGELNTVQQLNAFEKIQATSKFSVIPVNLQKAEDATAVTDGLVGKVDAIYIGGGTTVDKALLDITAAAKNNKILTVSHMADKGTKGVMMTVSSSSYTLGQLAAKKAVQVLKGKDPSSIPSETLSQYDITINKTTAKSSGIEIPPSVLNMAKDIIE